MKKYLLVVILSFGLWGTRCSMFQRGEGGTPSQIEQVAGSVAPLIPPPWGLLVGGLATIATGIASVGANKASNKAFKAKEKPSLLVSLATDHSWLMPTFGALAATLRASGLLHFSDAELAMLMTTLATPVGVKKVMRKPSL